MASTILYKFRSGTTFEALPLPGSVARLFDVKKGIVKAKKLDGTGMEFDLAVRNADTNEDYADERMVLPRGTRLIVQRLPAARGHGFLARVARDEQISGPAGAGSGGGHNQGGGVAAAGAPSGFYTIDGGHNDEDEFVSSGPSGEDRELAALQAVTNLRPDGPTMTGGGFTGGGGPGRPGPAGMGPPTGAGRGSFKPNNNNFRPNADPELRDQEKKLLPKKRATGIPRTFLNLSAPPQTDGANDGEGNESSMPLLQPNTIGFEELKNRGGGQSENAAGTKKDLEYALKLTATTIPDYIQCAICENVVKNAMLLPWDTEGRTTCESCIRDALTQNGYRCPLTGQDGVSPDDLIPNVGLRKAAEMFIKGVMEKIDEIEMQQVEETDHVMTNMGSIGGNIFDGDGTEKGVIVSKKTALIKKKVEDDPFAGGDDIFGGDIFAVETEKVEEEAEEAARADAPVVPPPPIKSEQPDEIKSRDAAPNAANAGEQEKPTSKVAIKAEPNSPVNNQDRNRSSHASNNRPAEQRQHNGGHRDRHMGRSSSPVPEPRKESQGRRGRRRGPPAGYAMGPAGSATSAIGSRGGGHEDAYHGGQGRGRNGRRNGERSGSFDDDQSGGHHHNRGRSGSGGGEHDNRGTKRNWEDQSGGRNPAQQHQQHTSDFRYGGGNNFHGQQPPPSNNYHGGGGGYDSSRGGRGGRGGGRWGGRGGRGRGYGRGRY